MVYSRIGTMSGKAGQRALKWHFDPPSTLHLSRSTSAAKKIIDFSNMVVLPAPVTTPAVTPNATYHYPKSEVALRIGTGGSGQSGLLEALAQAFIKL